MQGLLYRWETVVPSIKAKFIINNVAYAGLSSEKSWNATDISSSRGTVNIYMCVYMCICICGEERNIDKKMYICTSLFLNSSMECMSLNYPLGMHTETWMMVAQCTATDQEYQWQCPVSTLASYELKEILQSKTAGVDSCPMANWWLCDLLPDFHYFSCRCRPAITTIVTWWSQISLQMENALRVEKLSKSGFLNNRLEFEKPNFLPFCSVTLS